MLFDTRCYQKRHTLSRYVCIMVCPWFYPSHPCSHAVYELAWFLNTKFRHRTSEANFAPNSHLTSHITQHTKPFRYLKKVLCVV